MTDCTCPQPGYCPALGRQMPEARWRECSTSEAFCTMFHREAAAGKYQAAQYQTAYDPNAPQKTIITPPSFGLGDLAECVLSKLGFRKRKGCGCDKRKRFLNKIPLPPRWSAWVWCSKHGG